MIARRLGMIKSEVQKAGSIAAQIKE